MERKHIIALRVMNNTGVLARIAFLFARWGYNIDHLNVSVSNDPNISNMSITVTGNNAIVNRIVHQAAKLEEIIDIYTSTK